MTYVPSKKQKNQCYIKHLFFIKCPRRADSPNYWITIVNKIIDLTKAETLQEILKAFDQLIWLQTNMSNQLNPDQVMSIKILLEIKSNVYSEALQYRYAYYPLPQESISLSVHVVQKITKTRMQTIVKYAF